MKEVLEEDPQRRFHVFPDVPSRLLCVQLRGNEQSVVQGVEAMEIKWRNQVAGVRPPRAAPRVQAAPLRQAGQDRIQRNNLREKEIRTKRDQMVDDFYAHLDADRPLMQRCQDPIAFREEFLRWKSENTLVGMAPSSVLFALSMKRLILRRSENPYDMIVFKVLVARDMDGNRTMKDILEEQRRLVIEGRRDIEANRGGISIGELAFDITQDGKERVMNPGTNLEHPLSITNGNFFDVLLTEARVLKNAQDAFHCRPPTELPYRIQAGMTMAVIVGVTPRYSGVLRAIFSFSFNKVYQQDDSVSASFSIGRFAKVRCCNPDNYDIARPTKPYVKADKRRKRRRPGMVIVDGVKPEGGGGMWKKDCLPFMVPTAVKLMVRNGEAAEKLLAMREALGAPGGYENLFHNLLWVEELAMLDDMETFNMEQTTLRANGAYLELRVPGLAEKRPSVLKGDSIVAIPPGVQKGFRGYVHHVERDCVMLKFEASFHAMYGNVRGMTFDIEFTFRRTNLQIMHQGLAAFDKVPRRLFFPQPRPSFDPDDDISFVQFQSMNRDLNPEQQLAVSSILSIATPHERNMGPTPYVIYGPPGTGKTVTLVESIRQLIERYPDQRILITAPSNEAADLFITRLNAMSSNKMLRLNAFSRNERAVPQAVRDYSLENERGFKFPGSVDTLGRYTVVVATCATASRLWNVLGVPRGFFDTIVCDESGHAWEPEAAATFLNGLASDETVIVLAGDPKQLGPIVRSQVAKDAGLCESLLERLMKMPAYSKRGPGGVIASDGDRGGEGWKYDPMRVTKLLRNYRSHEAIIRLPNKMFYDNELIPSAHPIVTDNMLGGVWEHLKNPRFPLMFHGVVGEDTREETSPSWFNVEEANEVVNWVKLLTRDRPFVREQEIGIISPYAKQVQKMRMLLGANGMQNIMVGSTEMFQGQERRVIIISTVRSSKEWVMSDQRHNLGFLANPKRYNVAVTRAKALLIVVGNPHVLSSDPHWGELLRLCCDNGAYVGEEFAFVSESTGERGAAEALADALQAMAVRDDEGDDAGDHEAPAWHAMED